LRGPFDTLFTSIAQTHGIGAELVGETLLPDRMGKPDFAAAVNKIPCGYIELKAPTKGADTSKYKGRDKSQWERFSALPNILYSDGIEWALYRGGKAVRIVRLSGNPCVVGEAAISDKDAEKIGQLIFDFLQWEPIVPNTAKQLADYLAPLCRMLKDDVLDALNRGSSKVTSVARDWRKYLFPDADNKTVADAYAQVVTFALLLARTNGADTLFLDEAVASLTTKNTLLGRSLQILTDEEVRGEVEASLSMLQRVIKAIPSQTMHKGRKDPWLHFYEDFLQEYDPNLRKNAGAYYTPLQVVHAQTSLVEELLRTRMDKPLGFANGDVETLDPAVGTGTYLLSIIDLAMERVREKEGPGVLGARATLLSKCLYGFEMMVGPYAVATLRMTRMLQDYGGKVPQDGVQVILNNTLESPYEKIPELPFMYQALGKEHQRAKRVKESVPVLVCIGNPPYDRHEKVTDTNKNLTGAWVRWGDPHTNEPPILNDITDPVKAAGKGLQLKNLYNLYTYFWSWGLWKVFESEHHQQGGIVSYITASSFLDGDAFLGLRKKMRELCDEIWIIDLGGSGRGTQQDENVFAIQTPVAITIAVRYADPQPHKLAEIHYTRIEGTKAEKLQKLDKVKTFTDLNFVSVDGDITSTFYPKSDDGVYFTLPRLTDLMPWQHSGVQYKRNWPIAPTKETLHARWNSLIGSESKATAFRETDYRKISTIVHDPLSPSIKLTPIKDVLNTDPLPEIVAYGFRTLDRHFAFADNRLADRIRPPLWVCYSSKQTYFTYVATQAMVSGPALSASIDVPDLHHFCGRGAKDVIPLYRDSECKTPNIHPNLLEILSTRIGRPIAGDDWASYLYAVLSHEEFTRQFSDGLLQKDVRVPITLSPTLFERALIIGQELMYLHSFGERYSDKFADIGGSSKCIKGIDSPEVVTYSYDAEKAVLKVGDGVFGPVAKNIWEYEVSGFKVLQSWLGYRKKTRAGKSSSPLDAIGGNWAPGLTLELLKLLWIVERTLVIADLQADLLREIMADELLLASDLSPIGAEWRKPPAVKGEQNEIEM